MSTKKAWLSEEEMYEVLEQNELFNEIFINFGFENGTKILRFKQPIVSESGKRPDYIFCVSEETTTYIFIVEVKITAELLTLSQLKTYENYVNDFNIQEPFLPGRVIIQKIIIARFFDKSLQPFIDDWIGQEYSFYSLDLKRIDEKNPNKKEWQISYFDPEPVRGLESFKNELISTLGEINGSNKC